jgi:hypothetical protein
MSLNKSLTVSVKLREMSRLQMTSVNSTFSRYKAFSSRSKTGGERRCWQLMRLRTVLIQLVAADVPSHISMLQLVTTQFVRKQQS